MIIHIFGKRSGKMGQKGFSAVGSLFSDRLLGSEASIATIRIPSKHNNVAQCRAAVDLGHSLIYLVQRVTFSNQFIEPEPFIFI